MRKLLDMTRWLWHRPAQIDRETLRAEMTETDPDFARVREIHHAALSALTAKRAADGLAIRRERIFWEKHGGEHQ